MKVDRDDLVILVSAIIEEYRNITGVYLSDEADYLHDAAANGIASVLHAIRIVFGKRAEETLIETAVSSQELSEWITCNEYLLYQSESDYMFSFMSQIDQFKICKLIAGISRRHFPSIYPQCLNIAKKTLLSTREGQRKYMEHLNERCTL